jgi:hypothetical protein
MQSSNPRELVLQSNFGTLKLFVNSPLPKGSIVQFDLVQAAQVRGGAAPKPDISPLPSHFDAFDEITELIHYQPNSVNKVPPHIIPRPGPALAAEMLFLMTALQGGDLRKWMGEDNLRYLNASGKSDLVAALSNEYSALKTIPADSRDGQWHHILIPLNGDGAVKPVELFFKRQQHKSKDDGERNTDHFMVDVELTRMGRMQLDGLVQTKANQTQFDLIVRTHKEWDDAIQQNIRSIYMRAQEISGFGGSVQFRSGKEVMLVIPVDNTSKDASNAGSIMV